MSSEEDFLPYEVAKKIIGNVIEEEHIHESNRRILTVYDLRGKELCWYDAEEVLREVQSGRRLNDDVKIAAVEHIMRMIPAWAVNLDDYPELQS